MATKDTTTDGAQASRIETVDENPTLLGPDALMDDVEVGELYLGVVIESANYGVFVRLAEGTTTTDPITGLAHQSNFPPDVKIDDIKLHTKVAVRVDAITPDGPELLFVEPVTDAGPCEGSEPVVSNDGEQSRTGPSSDREASNTNTKVAEAGESFAADPLKSAAVDLLRLVDEGVSADRVVMEQTPDGEVRYEVVVKPDIDVEVEP